MKLSIHAGDRTKPLGDLFGLFFEDLNHAADGGLYAEMVQNRSFEYAPMDHPDYHALTGWAPAGGAALSIESGEPCYPENPHYLVLYTREDGEGIENLGYGEGMCFRPRDPLRLSFYAKCEAHTEVTVSIIDGDGCPLASHSLTCQGDWTRYECTLTSPVFCVAGRLRIACGASAAVCLDHISLLPERGYAHFPSIFRRDIVQALYEMKPKFLRFPGGCLIHDGTLNADDRDSMYRWKKTIGPVERRPSRRNSWRYNQSLGLGFYEYFLLAELLGARPLPVVSGGCDPHHRRFAEGEVLEEYIQDALDLIEFATGDASTEWGAVRAKQGHPAPFDLKYIGVGNEEVHQEFYDRFPLFARMIRERYPDIRIIGTASAYAAGSEFERGWRSARETQVDFVDEHYYQAPEWFIANAHRYGDYDPNGPKVFLGEYASWGNTYENALVEAMYMTGLQNAPAVGLACYAPMLCNSSYVNWKPDMIWYDNHRILLTPNYTVQKLFMTHQGDWLIKTKLELDQSASSDAGSSITGKLGLSANDTEIRVRDIFLKWEDGEKSFPELTLLGQELTELDDIDADHYELSMKMRRISGVKGMKVYFGLRDKENCFIWGVGGWENQDSILDARVRGRGTCLTQSLFSVEDDKEYELKLIVDGRRIRTYIDGILYNDATDRLPVIEELYVTVSEEETGDMILKAVNLADRPCKSQIEVLGAARENTQAEQYRIAGVELEAENTWDEQRVKPLYDEFTLPLSGFDYEFPAHSITILRLKDASKPVRH